MCSVLHLCRNLDCLAWFSFEGTSASLLLRLPDFDLGPEFASEAVIAGLTAELYSQHRVLGRKAPRADIPGCHITSD